jgi:hypothetical protein
VLALDDSARAPALAALLARECLLGHRDRTPADARDVLAVTFGNDGAPVRGTAAKLNALVRSPVTLRRQELRFGTSTPKRVSRKRSVEVWSNVSEHTSPPRENGDTTSIGTRKPRPTGPRMPAAALGSVARGQKLALRPLGRGRRRDMVEESAVLVPGDEQSRAGPDLGV